MEEKLNSSTLLTFLVMLKYEENLQNVTKYLLKL
jgi:hypothetical protein